MSEKHAYGRIGWVDLTIKNAPLIRDFYTQVVGWTPEPVSMGEYDDYNMNTAEDTAAGICHARGVNKDIPPQWMIYINVEDLDKSMERCLALGGEIIRDKTGMGSQGSMAIIKDPAGAVCALFEPAA